jgi:hypothetical protein
MQDGHLDQCLFHCWVAERIPLLQEMEPQQPLRASQGLGGKRIELQSNVLADFGVVGLSQVEQRLPGYHHSISGRNLSRLVYFPPPW